MPEARLWDGAYDVTHVGEIDIPPMNTEEKSEFWKRYNALPSLLAQIGANSSRDKEQDAEQSGISPS